MSANALTLRGAVLPRSTAATDAVLIAGGAGLVALAAQISIALPFTPVPITGQTFGVLLVGSALGSVRGLTSMALYLAVGLLGAPVFADRAHGWHAVSGATGGYLVGFLLAAAMAGLLAERTWDRRFSSAVAAMLTANVIIYTCGLIWLSHVLHAGLNRTLTAGLYPFVVGDLLKLYLAGALLPAAWTLVRRLR